MPGKYDHLSKEQLVALLEEREEEKRLGLVWEKDPALVGKDESVNDQFVTLSHVAEVSCGSGPQRNLIIEGDNYDALRLLRMTHAGRVKCIYIDPPYNTGNRDFIYNDRFIDKTDGWRHSKWIEFMHRRLVLAKDLLREDGVIFVSIDDNELFHLGMLMNEVFGEGNFLATIAWEKRYTRSNNARMFYSLKDSILVYRNTDALNFLREPRTEKSDSIYKNPDNDKRGAWTSASYVNPATKAQRPNLVYPIRNPRTQKDVEHPTHAWKFDKTTHAEHVANNMLWWGLKGDAKFPRLKVFPKTEGAGLVPVDLWSHGDSGTNDEGGNEVKAIFGHAAFTNPKPTKLIQRIIRLVTNPGDIIVDFFAGSGTTGHAVLKMNAEDGGNRQFILVSSTEATPEEPDKNLCRDVCAKRVKRVCEGYGEVKGLGGGFAYLRIEKMEPGRLLRRLQHEQVWITLQMMHLDTLTPEAPGGIVWAAGEGKRRLIYLTQTNEKTWGPLERALAEGPRATLYTWQPDLVKHHAPKATVRPIPKFLMERLGIQS